MEYTKDMIFQVHYDEVNNVLTRGKKRTSSFVQLIKRHKFITTAVLSAIVFISIDVVLVTNFFRILTIL